LKQYDKPEEEDGGIYMLTDSDEKLPDGWREKIITSKCKETGIEDSQDEEFYIK
jgi:hypothetical protein